MPKFQINSRKIRNIASEWFADLDSPKARAVAAMNGDQDEQADLCYICKAVAANKATRTEVMWFLTMAQGNITSLVPEIQIEAKAVLAWAKRQGFEIELQNNGITKVITAPIKG